MYKKVNYFNHKKKKTKSNYILQKFTINKNQTSMSQAIIVVQIEFKVTCPFNFVSVVYA